MQLYEDAGKAGEHEKLTTEPEQHCGLSKLRHCPQPVVLSAIGNGITLAKTFGGFPPGGTGNVTPAIHPLAALAAVGAMTDEIIGKAIIEAKPTFLIISRRFTVAKLF